MEIGDAHEGGGILFPLVLLKDVPEEGRTITRAETKLLLAQGMHCSVRWRVIPTDIENQYTLLSCHGQDTGIKLQKKMRVGYKYF